ncbi:hypothetical protein H3146_07335 [Streptomyces sp. OF3]|uniref:Uncharacterized protein n=1 Tax=Streptomyces alkaliterrae TaxID=2213162 RepID=A0A7W3ZLY1_9ACTN|nr:hypothetical protein [Streptomyces alkaliterrae]MBB1253183.1 hypothetical protein [Streptomyces alkaliterrae]
MPGYLIQHGGPRAEDVQVDADHDLYLRFHDGWLIISDAADHETGTVHYAAPRDHITRVQRID